MLQGQIALGKTEVGFAFILPSILRVGAFLFVPAGEKAGRAFIGVAKILAQNAGSVCEVDNVFTKEKIVLDQVPNDSTETCDVANGVHRHPAIRVCAGERASVTD